jgi:hypothetical protein
MLNQNHPHRYLLASLYGDTDSIFIKVCQFTAILTEALMNCLIVYYIFDFALSEAPRKIRLVHILSV